MATDPAADSPIGLTLIDPAPASPARRHYWQLPTFALGVVAAVAAWKAFPPKPADPADLFRRDLAALAAAADRRPVDPAAVEAQAAKVAAALELHPGEAARGHFLLGSADVALAEYGPPDAADACWLRAAERFTKCDPAQLADPADKARYAFRAAKATAALGTGFPPALVPALVALPPGEDPGERGRLLGETYLRLSPPDHKKARDELTGYLSGSHRGNPATAARMKLVLADLCMKLNEPDKARTWLKEIGTAAPADLRAMAKVQLARAAAADGRWDEAVKLFSAAQATPGLPAEQLGMIRYETGRGLMSLKNAPEAAAYFEQAQAAGGPSGVAAAVMLAELKSQDPQGKGNRARSAEYLEAAVKGLAPGGEFKNPHVSADDVRMAFEEVIRVAAAEGDYPAALRAVAAYAAVAEPGKDLERRAEVLAAQAKALAAAGEAAPARAAWGRAAADLSALAAAHPSPTAKLEFYRRAAAGYREAGDDPAALAALQAAGAVPGLAPDLTAAVHLDRGDLLTAGQKFADARDAYQAAATAGGVAGTQAQLKLGRAYLEEGRRRRAGAQGAQAAEASGMMEFGSNMLAQLANATFDTAPQREAQQEALFDLGRAAMRDNLAESEARFRQLLQLDPAGRLAEEARLWLGSCLLISAHPKGNAAPADAEKRLTEALALFELLARSDQPKMQAQADIRIVNVTQMLKRYDAMPALCHRLAEKYKGRPEELIVLRMLYETYVWTERGDLAARVFARLQDAYAKVPDEAFTGGMAEYTRDYWKKLFEPTKPR